MSLVGVGELFSFVAYCMAIALSIFFFFLGITLIIGGANALTDGSAALARRFGLSPLMVGLTIVALGTSAPELVVSLTSALKGSSDISLGNVVGSNAFNVLAIGGLTALVAPLRVTRSTVRREIPLLLLASLVLSVMVFDTYFSGIGASVNVITRGEGLVLLGFFAIFLAYTFAISKAQEDMPLSPEIQLTASVKDQEAPIVETEGAEVKKQKPIWVLLLLIVLGLGGLVGGGQLFVDAATEIARALGMSEAVIGLTLVAAGTSMPELATSVVAAMKGEHELAIGNIVGSGIFNIFLIIGLTSSISPVYVLGLGELDFGVMVVSAALLYLFAVFYGERTISRLEGGFLFCGYLAYTTYLLLQI